MRSKGFTLIELLVVISIVALLASIVLASLNSAREKGRLGSARYFAAQVDHVAGDVSIGTWELDECAGTTAADSSGNGNTGSFTGSPTWSTDTPSGKGCSLDITTGQGLSIPDKDILDIGTGSATRAMWFKTTQAGSASLFRKSDGSNALGMLFYLNGSGQFRCDAHFSPQVSQTSSVSGYNNGLWHYGVCVLDRASNILSIYVDGTFQGKSDASTISAVDLSAVAPVNFPSPYFDYIGKIDGMHFFNKALTASEVGKLYASERDLTDFAAK